MKLLHQLKIGLTLLSLLTILTGVIYPAIVTGFAQIFFPWKANGSLVEKNGKAIASLLIGQANTDPNYFWGRPSATTPVPYNAENSSGSNMSPGNREFLAAVNQRVSHLQKTSRQAETLIPIDLVTASGSGLDPEISPQAAYYQISRLSKTRHVSQNELQLLIDTHTKPRTLGLLGEPRVNVLELNLALDNLRSSDGNTAPKS